MNYFYKFSNQSLAGRVYQSNQIAKFKQCINLPEEKTKWYNVINIRSFQEHKPQGNSSVQEERQRLWTLGGVSCLQFFRPEIKGLWSQRRETSKQVAFWLTSKPLLKLEPGGSHQGNLLKSIWPSQTVSLCVEMKDLNRSVNQRI